jgi:hypothetical protein
MSKVRVVLACLVVLIGCGFVGQAFADDEEGGGGGPKCACYFPNSGAYGVFDTGGHCVKQDCWVPLKLEE